MKRVFIESPYAGDVERNLRYMRACLTDSFARGEAPFASHGLYPLVLDDNYPTERRRGLDAAKAWRQVADVVAVYTDLGISPGMREGIELAEQSGIQVDLRRVEGWKP
jgi:hypothetical protein